MDETKPELSEEEFTEKHHIFMAEVEALMTKHDVHAMVFTFGFESGESMIGAAGVMGCAGCCIAVFDRLINERDRVYVKITMEAMQHHGHEVH
jgi:hypothetical protein